MSYDNNRIIAEATAIGEHFDRNYFTKSMGSCTAGVAST